jgi:hypothetical protein
MHKTKKMKNVKLNPKSEFAGMFMPESLATKVAGKWYASCECSPIFSGGFDLTKNITLIEGIGYPKGECGRLQVSAHNTAIVYLPNYPDRVTTADGALIASPALAKELGFTFYKDRWRRLENNSNYHEMSRINADIVEEYSLGIEIEKNDKELLIEHKALPLYDTIRWAKERDGSLGDYGFELVSPIYDLFKDTVENDILVSPLKELINAKFDDRCGGHINIGCVHCSPGELFKKFKFIYPLLYAMYPHRNNNRYCQVKHLHDYDDKYAAIYKKSYALEFRIFPAVENITDLLWRLRFMRHIVKRDLSESAIFADIDNENSELNSLLLSKFKANEVATIKEQYPILSKKYVHSNS